MNRCKQCVRWGSSDTRCTHLNVLCILFLFWAQTGLAYPSAGPTPPVTAEIYQLTQAQERGQHLRLQLVGLGSGASEENRHSQDTVDQLRQARAEYYRLRESLFRPALLHASSIVQRLEPENKDAVLRNTAISILVHRGNQ